MSWNAALATEIALEFDEQPVFATVGPWPRLDWWRSG